LRRQDLNDFSVPRLVSSPW